MIALSRIATTFATLATAASLALWAPTPARADSGDTAKAIAGIAALAIIANQLDKNSDSQRGYRPQPYPPAYPPPAWGRRDPQPPRGWRDEDRHRRHDAWGRNDGWGDNDWNRRNERSAGLSRGMPRQCLVQTWDGRAAYDARCLDRLNRR